MFHMFYGRDDLHRRRHAKGPPHQTGSVQWRKLLKTCAEIVSNLSMAVQTCFEVFTNYSSKGNASFGDFY